MLAPAKVNLCLFLGPTRQDGRHELVSLMQPLAWGDDVSMEEAERDEVVCPGVEGPNLAAEALAAFRRAAGGPPARLRIDKRIPVAAGMAGGSADAGAALRLAAGRADVDDDALLLRIAEGLGADVPAQVRPARVLATGAGERLEPVAPAPRFSVLVLPSAHALPTGDVFGEADRLGLARDDLGERLAAVRAGLDEGPFGLAEEPARQRPPGGGALAVPVGRRGPGRRARGGRGPCARLGQRPDRGRAVRGPGRRGTRGAGARRAPPRRRGDGAAGVKPFPLVFAAAALAYLIRRRRRLETESKVLLTLLVAGLAVYGSGVVELPNLEKVLEGAGSRLGKWTYLLVGAMAFAETGAFLGFVAPGEFTVLLGGLVAGQGKIDVIPLLAIVWACAVAGDVTSYVLGRRLGRAFMVRHGPASRSPRSGSRRSRPSSSGAAG